eukprot:CAMPEP_0195158114 /NCGR_PEP_ID=MMETSP0448-20130528/185502_1 /TAXON_ID=66468 /ORGANISM="Heterocapsa triquestra, Strain CCMP 448" /LENGTH=92 /DNA_ID=CAMNT_0040196909 /DNA_START=984 /DNA_END=1258 /DNA_ORIENTATION=-
MKALLVKFAPGDSVRAACLSDIIKGVGSARSGEAGVNLGESLEEATACPTRSLFSLVDAAEQFARAVAIAQIVVPSKLLGCVRTARPSAKKR